VRQSSYRDRPFKEALRSQAQHIDAPPDLGIERRFQEALDKGMISPFGEQMLFGRDKLHQVGHLVCPVL
jgi:hypothetical protein